MSKRYYQGESFPQRVKVTDREGVLVDPDTIIITIVDPNGTKEVDGEDMIKEEVGEYKYIYALAVDAEIGEWSTEVEAEKGFIQIEQDKFTVMEAL